MPWSTAHILMPDVTAKLRRITSLPACRAASPMILPRKLSPR